MWVLIVCLIVTGFGLGGILAAIAAFIRNRNARPSWAYQTDRDGRFAGKR